MAELHIKAAVFEWLGCWVRSFLNVLVSTGYVWTWNMKNVRAFQSSARHAFDDFFFLLPDGSLAIKQMECVFIGYTSSKSSEQYISDSICPYGNTVCRCEHNAPCTQRYRHWKLASYRLPCHSYLRTKWPFYSKSTFFHKYILNNNIFLPSSGLNYKTIRMF